MSEQQPNIEEDHAQADQFGQLTGHNYDGIQEYDNPTPAWWTWVFLVTVAFTPIYMFFTLLGGDALGPEGEYERAYVANLERQFGSLGELKPDAETILKYADDEKWRAFGKNVYRANCVQCHGANAQGLANAPNLTDEYYIYVDKVEDIADVIINGRKGVAMPAWGNRLHPNEIVLVSSYIASLRGENVPGNGPQGEVPPPWGAGADTGEGEEKAKDEGAGAGADEPAEPAKQE